MPDRDSTTEYPVLSHEPVVIPRPRVVVRRLAIAYIVATLIVGASSAYIGATVGYNRASERTDRRVATLERDLAERRAARAQQDAVRDEQVRRLREIVCTFADRAWPRDADVDKIRSEFGCTGGPFPLPQTAPGVFVEPRTGGQVPGPRSGSGGGTSGGGQPGPVPQPPAQPPVQQPPAPPDEQPDDGFLCLPILGCLL